MVDENGCWWEIHHLLQTYHDERTPPIQEPLKLFGWVSDIGKHHSSYSSKVVNGESHGPLTGRDIRFTILIASQDIHTSFPAAPDRFLLPINGIPVADILQQVYCDVPTVACRAATQCRTVADHCGKHLDLFWAGKKWQVFLNMPWKIDLTVECKNNGANPKSNIHTLSFQHHPKGAGQKCTSNFTHSFCDGNETETYPTNTFHFPAQGIHPWKLTWHRKISLFNRKYIFIHSGFSLFLLVFTGG